jgi:hypothetical protein
MMKLTTAVILLIISGFIIFYIDGQINSTNAQTFDKTIFFPEINVTGNNYQNSSLDEEFILINNSIGNNTQNIVKVVNPDFGLYSPFIKLVGGQKYLINLLNDEDIKYNNISIKLAKIISVSPNINNLTYADPENPNELKLGPQIDLAHYIAEQGEEKSNINFIMPKQFQAGNYILYVYLQYPYGITGVFSNAATLSG